jgi:hypothetical protein
MKKKVIIILSITLIAIYVSFKLLSLTVFMPLNYGNPQKIQNNIIKENDIILTKNNDIMDYEDFYEAKIGNYFKDCSKETNYNNIYYHNDALNSDVYLSKEKDMISDLITNFNSYNIYISKNHFINYLKKHNIVDNISLYDYLSHTPLNKKQNNIFTPTWIMINNYILSYLYNFSNIKSYKIITGDFNGYTTSLPNGRSISYHLKHNDIYYVITFSNLNYYTEYLQQTIVSSIIF